MDSSDSCCLGERVLWRDGLSLMFATFHIKIRMVIRKKMQTVVDVFGHKRRVVIFLKKIRMVISIKIWMVID